MDQRVNEQVATRNHAEELAIDHMCDPCEWMPVRLVKSGERPGESRERNTMIHHRVFLDIRIVIQRDELMSHYLRVKPKYYYRQTEHDEEIGSLKCCSSACVSLTFAHAEKGIFLPWCGDTPLVSLLRSPFSHALARLSDRLDPPSAQIVSDRVLLRRG